MGIKGKIPGLMAALLLPCLAARAQEVVIDPSQIAASAVNAADQVDYMIDQLGELTDLGDKLAGLKGYMDDLFGEDGVGGKAIGLLQDLGTIDRLAECYTSTMESAERYAARCRESGNWRMSDVNAILSYLNSSKREAEMILETVKKLLATAGFTKKEKMDQVDRAVAELETRLETMRKVMEIEEEAAQVAEGLSGFSDIVSRAADSREYVESRRDYGTQQGAAKGALGTVSVIMGLMAALLCAFSFIIFARGGITGDPTAENIFLRLGTAMIAGSVVIGVISRFIGVTL